MKTPLVVVLLVLSIIFHPRLAHAEWLADGTVISAASNYQHEPLCVSDGAGGAIIVWADWRNGNPDIYAQRVDANGAALWTADGVVICNAAFDQTFYTIAADGSGGALLTWQDRRGGSSTDIYAQRINGAGAAQWTANGVLICGAANEQKYATIIADGSGGAIIAWQDPRVGMGLFYDIYAQHINALGLVQWTANGVVICNTDFDQYNPTLASDGSGGAIISWHDNRSNTTYDIYAQRIGAAGVVQWAANGVVICNALNQQAQPLVTSDGVGGALITWNDARAAAVTGYDIYVQRINSTGAVQWGANGVVLCNATGTQYTTSVASDGAGGVIATWYDFRGGIGYDIYARRMDSTGAALWTANGNAICTADDEQFNPAIAADGAGGAVVTWHDNRSFNSFDIYAQRVNSAGTALWTAGGVALCTATRNQMVPTLAADGTGGAIVAWMDARNNDDFSSTDDIYARRIAGGGLLPTAVRPMTPSASLSVGESYPNPFAMETAFDVTLRNESTVNVEVFDVAGRRVRSIDMGRIPAGATRLAFDGLDERSRTLPSGVYFYRVHAGSETVTKKMVIAR